jgi:hypothetical protein
MYVPITYVPFLHQTRKKISSTDPRTAKEKSGLQVAARAEGVNVTHLHTIVAKKSGSLFLQGCGACPISRCSNRLKFFFYFLAISFVWNPLAFLQWCCIMRRQVMFVDGVVRRIWWYDASTRCLEFRYAVVWSFHTDAHL